jgi:hypothetical protein
MTLMEALVGRPQLIQSVIAGLRGSHLATLK